VSPTTGIPQRPVAVVGLGAVASGANDPEELWQVLLQTEPRHREPSRFDLAPGYSPDPQAEDRSSGRTGGYIDGLRLHPALQAEVDAGCWERGDQELLWLRQTLLQTLETTTLTGAPRAACYVATWLGASASVEDTLLAAGLPSMLADHLAVDPSDRAVQEHRLRSVLRARYGYAVTRPRMLAPDMLVRRATSGLLAPGSDWLTVSAACASALYAIDLGIQSLLAGECDVAFCGSVNGMGRLMAVAAAKFQGMSATGDVRSFDAAADGTLFGEGATTIALKRVERARADGDRILGYLTGSGLATDGRGKSMAAPNPAGLRRAVDRAWESGAVRGEDVDWMLAHGTGTLAGDQVEIEVLSAVAPDRGLLCTSNKSLIGHAAWAAGGLSVVHALLALRHDEIPAQQRFTVPHPDLAVSRLQVPTEAVPWPARQERPRVVDIGSLGVGGANAQLLLQDRLLPQQEHLPEPDPEQSDIPVLVAWTAWLPGDPSPERIRGWLTTGADAPDRRFPQPYPASAFQATRLPPVVTRDIDRTHLLALDISHRFATEHGELWNSHRERTGVITAHTGPTRSWVDATVRACAADLEQTLHGADRAALELLLKGVRERQRISEETLAGGVPSLAAYRITNRWDLHGPSMGIDAGGGSACAAIHTACRYLRQQRMDLALVVCMNEGSTPLVAEFTGHPAENLAEGAFLLALTRESFARAHGWPVLAGITSGPAPGAQQTATSSPGHDYLGAQGAVDLLRAVHTGGTTPLLCAGPALRITVSPPAQAPAPAPGSAPAAPSLTSRWASSLRRADARPRQRPGPAIPHRSAVLVGSAQLAADLAGQARAAGARLFSTDPATPPDLAVVVDDRADESAVLALLAPLDGLDPQLRVVASVREHTDDWPTEDPRLTRLLELTLLAIKRYDGRLGEGTAGMLLLDPLTDLQVHPDTAQFTGFVRSLGWELSRHRVFALVTDAPPAQALAELAEESAAHRDSTVAYRHGGLRHTEQLVPLPLPSAGPEDLVPALPEAPVVVAIGGAHGIAAVALEELSRRHRPFLWLLGRTDPDAAPAEILGACDADQARLRAAFIARERRTDPTADVAHLNRLFQTQWRARDVAATLARLRALCGAERVRYLPCDITDAGAVTRAADLIGRHTGRIDLLVNSAFVQESARCESKSLAAFRRVHRTKVTGYRNLRAAFAASPPQLWCNFGSSIVLLGLPGETDYTAGSDFLSAAARYQNRLRGTAELTIGWGLWEEAGSAADPGTRDRLARTGVTHGVTNEQGVACFLAELSHPRSIEPAPVHTTAEDRGIAESRFPGSVATIAEPVTEGGLLGDPDELDAQHARWTWRLDPVRDHYLLEHLVQGRAVLPGMCMVAMAAEAADRLRPGAGVAALQDISFKEFVPADPTVPGPTKYRIIADARDGGPVRVRIVSDVLARDGRVLRRDREHARLDVVTGPLPPAPAWAAWSAEDDDAMADPYCRSDAPIRLTGPFRNSVDITAGRHRARSRWQPLVSPADFFSRSSVPILLLDALGRTACFPQATPGRAEIQAPVGIRRLDLYIRASDSQLADRYPEGIDLYGDVGQSRFTAVVPDGRVIARITGLERRSFGTVPVTGLPRTPVPSTVPPKAGPNDRRSR